MCYLVTLVKKGGNWQPCAGGCAADVSYSWLPVEMPTLTPNLVRLAPNETDSGLFQNQIIFQYGQNVLKSARFVPFAANLTHFGPQCGPQIVSIDRQISPDWIISPRYLRGFPRRDIITLTGILDDARKSIIYLNTVRFKGKWRKWRKQVSTFFLKLAFL